MNKKYVIKNGDIGFVFLHADKRDISTSLCKIEDAVQYTSEEINFIYNVFKSTWRKLGLSAYEVKPSLGERYIPY